MSTPTVFNRGAATSEKPVVVTPVWAMEEGLNPLALEPIFGMSIESWFETVGAWTEVRCPRTTETASPALFAPSTRA